MSHSAPGIVRSFIFSAFFFLSVPALAQEAFEFWPDADYDPAIPSFQDVLGYAPGERITWHKDVLKYFEALQAAAPGRVVIQEYAKSWEGRSLIYVAIASAENIARMDEIKASMQRLSDPRTISEGDADNLIRDLPGVVWLSYAVHGNEISSTDAAMMTAYHLLASRGDDRVADMMANSFVLIDPLQNPDGRDRFIHNFEIAEGLQPDPDPLAAEHNEPWPGGRTNHYLFDLNRDWFMQTQPETQGKAKAIREWLPLAFVDAHEMGGNSTYYFAPEAIPYNPHLAKDQRDSLELFGRNNARWFDAFGFDYFTREVFDAFYPGYGASWPAYFGSVGMTYEQGSARGLNYRRYDGKEFHYRDTVRNHFVTSLSTVEIVARNREKLIRDFFNYHKSAIEEGASEDIRSYIIPTQNDQAGADKLAGLLVRQGVDVGQANDGFRACGADYAAGSYVINLDQPAKRFIRNMMDPDVPIEEGFLAEQERRRDKNLPDEIYDVTAWSLPLMMNVTANSCNRPVGVAVTAATDALIRPGAVENAGAGVSYLVPWGDVSAVRFLTAALRQGLDVKSTDLAFTNAGRDYPAGTLILDVTDNPDDLSMRVQDIARMSGADVVGVDDSWVTAGPNFGSNNVVTMNAPRVAIAWDQGTGSSSAGNTRFIIERQLGYPVSAIRTNQLARADLSRYQVLILPEQGFFGGGYAGVLGKAGADNLKDWVSRGGVLIGLGSAMRYLADPSVDLASARREDAVRDGDAAKGNGAKDGDGKEKDKGPATVPGKLIESVETYKTNVQPNKESPDSVAGVLVRAHVDPDHWLGAGVAENLNVLIRGRDIYAPLTLDQGRNVAYFAAADDLHLSGYLWDENRQQLAFKPFVTAEQKGRGVVIGFTQDPNVRAYLDGLNLIFANAIFRGAAHARPVR